MSTEDGGRSGRPKEVVSHENIKKITKMILNDHLQNLSVHAIKREHKYANVTHNHQQQKVPKTDPKLKL
ncbi:hypothetical protein GWI33_015957 [Rhynchophorus ferrugineus]|uniref:Uncharacterized protein n=1 Tax=Rhynchophorus ferrugineus TaxID=354439 RepID=A0A834HYU1_RHYFE|nr:hypothetical protein GWI33_015957 [Rhynchophorus ferrugineus]